MGYFSYNKVGYFGRNFWIASVVEVDKTTATPDISIALEVPVAEPNSSISAVSPLINLKEEPIATYAEEEPKASANSSVV